VDISAAFGADSLTAARLFISYFHATAQIAQVIMTVTTTAARKPRFFCMPLILASGGAIIAGEYDETMVHGVGGMGSNLEGRMIYFLAATAVTPSKEVTASAFVQRPIMPGSVKEPSSSSMSFLPFR